MRLICPSCGAQYEVPAEVIPKTGRDVQCSDCGTTWFQHHPDHPAAENVVADSPRGASEGMQDNRPEAAAPGTDSAVETETDVVADYTAEEETSEADATPNEAEAAKEEEAPETDVTVAQENDGPDPQDGKTVDPEEPENPSGSGEFEAAIESTDFEIDEEADVSGHDAWPEPGQDADHLETEEPVNTGADDVKAALPSEQSEHSGTAESELPDADLEETDSDETNPDEIVLKDREAENPETETTETKTTESDDPTATEAAGKEVDSDGLTDEDSEAFEPGRDLPHRRPLDEGIAKVLQQEAEREALAREEERRSGLESQPELGLTQSDSTAHQRTLEAEARMARLRGDDAAATETSPNDSVMTIEPDDLGIDPSSRSNLLPDIDEINSSLDPETGHDGQNSGESAKQAADAKRTEFRMGFRLAVLTAVLGVLLYVFAPQISAAIPLLEGVLSAFVGFIDGIQAQLDSLADTFVESIEIPDSE